MIERNGKIVTFYSFKGGVGRSMALANVATLLAQWGMRVLLIDWDLEAPGVERFFETTSKNIRFARKRQPGVVDLISKFQTTGSLQWREAIIDIQTRPNSEPIHIMTAGKSDKNYFERLQQIDWENLFSENDLGNHLDEVRREWLDEYDYVLIDSRTGVSDIGGISTILFPDILVLFFTTNHQSVHGVNDVMKRAQTSQNQLPFDRTRLIGIPVPARDESRSEGKLAEKWYKLFAKELGWIYKEWLPANVTPREVIDKIRIPYVPRWSFFEGLPVLVEGTDAPESIGAAYERLARLIFFDCAWEKTESGPHPLETLDVLRRLANKDEEKYSAQYAESLEVLGIEQMESGDYNDAVSTFRNVIEIYQRLSNSDPNQFDSSLAQALNNLSVSMSSTGDVAAALEANREGVAISRRMAAENPARYEVQLATSLNNLSNRLSAVGDMPAALESIREAVEIRRRLAVASPARYEPDLAGSLNNLSADLSYVSDNLVALEAIREAVDIFHRLAAASPPRYEPELAASLNNLSNCLISVGDMPAALEASRRAVGIYRRLAAVTPSRYEPNVAGSLNNLSSNLSSVGENSAALEANHEAVEILRRLAAASPARYEPDLAGSLKQSVEPLERCRRHGCGAEGRS